MRSDQSAARVARICRAAVIVRAAVLAAVLLTPTLAREAAAQVAREEALAMVYPKASIRPERVFLTPEQLKQAASLAGTEVPSALVARYVATRDGAVVGRAYVDTHVVRTKKESLLIALDASGRLRRIEVTAFMEPPEYQAPGLWLDQYRDRPLAEDLRIQRAIRPIAGATLTARAVNDAARRVLAIDRVLESPRPGTSK